MTVEVSDIEAGSGRALLDGEILQVSRWIDDAKLLIRRRLGDLAELDQEALDYVVREAVIERMRNPDGVDEETESIDDYSRSWKRSGTKRVTIWPEWWALLSNGNESGVFSARPSFEPDNRGLDLFGGTL